jgi:hypothetical protein
MTPFVRGVVEVIVKRGAIVKDSALVTVCGVGLVESVAVTLIVKAPLAPGVPEMTPEALTLNPVGKPLAVHVMGELPPVAFTVAL